MFQIGHAQNASRSAAARTLAARVKGARPFGALLVAFALLLQTTLAERHFEPLAFSANGAAAVLSSAGDTAPAPLTGQADDCALCQFLALGTATDVPHGSIDWLRAALDAAMPTPTDHAQPRESLRGTHQARAPPSPTIA